MTGLTADSHDGLVYLSNIPPDYHARDLRSFFSQYIEASGFTCFHFRHRNELPFNNLPRDSLDLNSSSIVSLVQKKNRRVKIFSTKLCCFITLPNSRVGEFILAYTGMHWFSTTADVPLPDQCLIRRVHLDNANDFADSSVIKKLRLDFCKSNQRTYCAVPYDYGGSHSQEVPIGLLSGELRTQKGLRIVSEDEYLESQFLEGISDCIIQSFKYSEPSAASDRLSEDDHSDEAAEDWERFESLHDDPYKVERGDKANIKYEDKVELVWEKGGSGLVFHTDEYTWRKLDSMRKEEFFDEPASFDWDIDMEAYENPKNFSIGPRPTGHRCMARDTSDLIDMSRKKGSFEHAESIRDLKQCTTKKIADEYGLRLMRRMGWLPGNSTRPGSSLIDILPSPYPKKAKVLPHKGLGYHGPRLIPSLSCDLPPVEACKSRSVYIRTAFDQPNFVKARTETTWQWPSLPDRQSTKIPNSPPHSDDLPAAQQQQALASVRSRTIILSHNAVPLSREGITFVSGGLLRPASFRIIPPR